MTPQHEVARELAANAEALRCLARDLVGPAMANDLVQETALRALRSPPPEPHGLGAWLATILRRLAGNHHRDTRRRLAREAAALRADDLHPAADEEAARREQLQALTRSLWRLPEPYQSALVWRYFENLTPKQIAVDKRLPLATVKSRLQRGLALLRAELDRGDAGSWCARLALAIAVPSLPSPTLSSPALAATVIMTPTTKLLAATAVLAAAACLVFVLDPGAPPLEPDAPGTRHATVAAVEAGVDARREERRRELVGDATAAAAVDLAHEHLFRLRCTVLDRDGLPVTGARIVIAPRDCQLNEWPVGTNVDGAVELQWCGKLPAMTVAVGMTLDDRAQVLREIDVRAGEVQSLVLLAERGGGGGACIAVARQKQVDCRACHVGSLMPDLFEHGLVVVQWLHPHSRIGDLLVGVPATDDEAASYFNHGFTESASEASDPAVAACGRVRGRVVDEDGAPVAGTTVIWGVQPDRAVATSRTLADGTFEFERVLAGTVQVRAGGGSPGIGRASLQVFEGRTSECDLRLQRGAVLSGRVLLPEGAVAEGWRVEYVATDGSCTDGTAVAANNSFALANLPAGPCSLLLWSRDPHRLPAAVDATALVGSTDLCFDLRDAGVPSGVLRVAPECATPGLAEGAAVFVWQVASRRGAMATLGADGVRELDGLPAGFYRVAIGAIGSGWQDLGQHWVDGRGATDLGRVSLRASGTVHLVDRDAGQTVQFYLRRAEMDLRGEAIGEPRDTVLLPQGRWLALWGAASNLRMREFDVGPGTVTELSLAGPR